MMNRKTAVPRSGRYVHAMPFGAAIMPQGGVLFRLWAPKAQAVELCLEEEEGLQEFLLMDCLADGWFQLAVPAAAPGTLYRFRIDSGLLVPDPASRRQFGDVHGPSVVVDPEDFSWPEKPWPGRPWEEAIIYEIHVGAFSPAGTFAGVVERLDYLVELGVTAIELMPVADFPGRRNWGYDGVLLFSPAAVYGSPADLKRLVRAAHARGLMVFLDVVYNHLGPEGNYLHVYGGDVFFTDRYQTPWGSAVNFQDQGSRPVRDFFIHNALYWLEEYRFDGLRLDAVHAIFDNSSPGILTELAATVRQRLGRRRHIHLILENDNNEAHYLARDENGSPAHFTAQWNDDLHHACHVLLTGEKTGYYLDYAAAPLRHLGRCLAEGFAYQGEVSAYRHGACRGEKSAHLPSQAFVSFLQNHDQIGNRALGERLTTLAPEPLLRIMAALVLLAPSPPLLFMGEEFGARTPFLFFCDFGADLARSVTEGRRREFAGFPEFAAPELQARIPDPNAIGTFKASCLCWPEQKGETGRRFQQLYKTLLRLRRQEIVPRLAGMRGGRAEYRLIGPKALQVGWVLGDGSRLRVIVNFAAESEAYRLPPAAALIYAAPDDRQDLWQQHRIPPQAVAWFLETREG